MAQQEPDHNEDASQRDPARRLCRRADRGGELDSANPQWPEAGPRCNLDTHRVVAFSLGWQEWSKFSSNKTTVGGDRVRVLDRNWDDLRFIVGTTVYLVGDCSSNVLALVGATLRYDF